jgi:hypothetical protein
LVHRVDLAAGTCSCEATVEMCRHRRIALIRQTKTLARLEDQHAHEILDVDERGELADLIVRLRRELGSR